MLFRSFGGAFVDKEGNLVTTSAVNKAMEGIGVNPKTLLSSINARGGGSRLSTDVFLDGLVKSGIITKAQKSILSKKVFNEYASEILTMPKINDRNNPIWSVSNRVLEREFSNNPEAIQFWQEYSRMPGSFAHPIRRSSTAFLNEITLGNRTVNFANLEASGRNKFYHAKESSNPFISLIERLISTGGRNFVVRNRGASFAANRGGRVPGYNRGGRIRGYQFGGGVGRMLGAGILSSIGASGGAALGQFIGGMPGQVIGGTLGSMLGMGLLTNSIKQTAELNKQQDSLLKTVLKFPIKHPIVIGLVAATAAAVALNKKFQETGRISRLAFAGGVKPLEDFNSKIKDVKKSIEDARAARELMNAQFTSAGLPGLVLTAEQFGKLKDEVAKTYPELVKLIKATDQSKLRDVARGLKAQFVAAGDSAAQANAKIAALLQLGEKGGYLSAILGSEGVKGIRDAKSAIDSMLSALNPKGDVGQFAESILQIFTSSDEYISKQKDSGNAVKDILEQINKSSSKNVTLTDNQISKLKDLSPELGKVLKNTDTVGTAFAKWRIVLSGVTKDLSNLTNDQLNTLAEYATKISGYFDKIKDVSSKEAQSNAATGEMAKAIDKFNKQQANASSSVLQNLDDQISSKKDLIDLIKKEAEERKKALRDQQSAEDTKLQIQQEQLAYQDALATGDMSAAAQAQINIQRLVGASQLQAAEKAIDENAQNRINQLENAINSLNNRAGQIQSSTASQTPKTSPLQSIYDSLNAFLKDVALNNPQGNFTEKQLTTFNSYLTQLSKIPGGQKYIDQLSNNGPVSMVTDRSEGANDVRTLLGTSQGAALGYDLQRAINSNQVAAGMGPTNKILLDILAKISGNKDIIGTADFKVTGTTVTQGDLTRNNISYKQGTKFTDSTGTEYRVTGLDGSLVIVEPTKTSTVKTPSTIVTPKNAKGNAMGGYIRHYEPGGAVFGPGTATSDSIPAYLSNGEYVVRAAAVSKLGVPFFDGINKMANGGMATYSIPSSKSYGMLGYNRGGSVNNYNVGGLTMHFANGGEVDGRMLFEQFKQAMKQDQLRSGRTIYVGGAA